MELTVVGSVLKGVHNSVEHWDIDFSNGTAVAKLHEADEVLVSNGKTEIAIRVVDLVYDSVTYNDRQVFLPVLAALLDTLSVAGGDGIGVNVYDSNGTLTGNRVVDLNAGKIGFSNGYVGAGIGIPVTPLDVRGAGIALSGTSMITAIIGSNPASPSAAGTFIGYDPTINGGLIGPMGSGAPRNFSIWNYDGTAWYELIRFNGDGSLQPHRYGTAHGQTGTPDTLIAAETSGKFINVPLDETGVKIKAVATVAEMTQNQVQYELTAIDGGNVIGLYYRTSTGAIELIKAF